MNLVQSKIAVQTADSVDDILEAFRTNFRMVAGCTISDDGREMKYQLRNEKGADAILSNANAIILANSLPLEAKIDTWKSGRLVHNVALVITYKP